MPVIAAAVAAYLIIQNLQKYGPQITIRFENATGLDPNQTVVRYRGVRVGAVQSIRLTGDMNGVEVQVRLRRFASGLAREGTVFWVVRPELGAAGIHALDTIVSGAYIEALPAPGSRKTQFNFIGATEEPPLHQGNGTEFILRTPMIRSLGPNSPVFYRGLQAGQVEFLELSSDSTVVNVHVWIKSNFVPLIRSNTVWWNAGGVDVSWHLLSGLSMTAENLRSIVTGGISFATPTDFGELAAPQTMFTLYEKPDLRWSAWSPHLDVTNAELTTPGRSSAVELENINSSEKQPQQQP